MVDFRRWRTLQEQVASCSQCVSRWPDKVVRPLGFDEIPDPPKSVDVLFVGVAPTPVQGKNAGEHFYTSVSDPLRVGLFRLLEEKFRVPLNAKKLEDGNRSFHKLACFFVHCAKARPIRDPAPPIETIHFCAARHLRAEIPVLSPRAICFLGKNNAGPAAKELF